MKLTSAKTTCAISLLLLASSAWTQTVTTIANGLNGPRVNGSNQLEDIVTGLVVLTGLTTGPDGALYLSNFGAAPAGLGQILRVELAD